MKIIHHDYDDFEKFIYDMAPVRTGLSKWKDCIFRGEDSDSYKLIPSALRQENERNLPIPNVTNNSPNLFDTEFSQILSEFLLLNAFYKCANNAGLKIPHIQIFNKLYMDTFNSEVIEILYLNHWIIDEIVYLAALAQHYGVMTRLLDWTQDFNVALYFAATGALRAQQKESGPIDEKIVIWALNAGYVTANTYSKAFPLQLIIPSYSDNPNLNAQKGILSLWKKNLNPNFTSDRKLQIPCIPVDRRPLDELIEGTGSMDVEMLHRITLPKKDSQTIFRYIRNRGYDAARLFPGYSGVTQKMADDLLVEKRISMRLVNK